MGGHDAALHGYLLALFHSSQLVCCYEGGVMDIVLLQLIGTGAAVVLAPVLCLAMLIRSTARKPCIPYTEMEQKEISEFN